MTDTVVLVTGGSRGIGAAVSRKVAALGHKVIVNYTHNQAAADALVEEIKAAGGEAVAVQGDVQTKPTCCIFSPKPTSSALLRVWSTMPVLSTIPSASMK